jgi:RimJ/RimL family protein N-acetyltransferase
MPDLALRPWSEADLPLLEQLLGDPEMMEHLGGPETPDQLRQRHQRYLRLPETDHMFVITLDGESVGSIGYWEKKWRDALVYEMGWHVLTDYQGQGIATRAGKLTIDHARSQNLHQYMHAFPSVDNPPSNAICRKLGFTLLEECDFEYPAGHPIRVNDWRLNLFSSP